MPTDGGNPSLTVGALIGVFTTPGFSHGASAFRPKCILGLNTVFRGPRSVQPARTRSMVRSGLTLPKAAPAVADPLPRTFPCPSLQDRVVRNLSEDRPVDCHRERAGHPRALSRVAVESGDPPSNPVAGTILLWLDMPARDAEPRGGQHTVGEKGRPSTHRLQPIQTVANLQITTSSSRCWWPPFWAARWPEYLIP